jgi:hypothetical protein
MRNPCTNLTIIIIPIIQKRREEGFSSSSRSFKDISLSLHEGKIVAKISAIMKTKRMLKITIETGF